MADMADYAEPVNGESYWGYEGENQDGPAGVGCRHCLVGPLYWGETRKGWRLFDAEGKLHKCRVCPKCTQILQVGEYVYECEVCNRDCCTACSDTTEKHDVVCDHCLRHGE